jgi:glycolate oxidase iron-sulfur subunit
MNSLSDLTSQCIRCGFCLESCPTFVLTGRETESPRGRIYLARSADEGKIAWEETRHAFDTCLGCRACEPACPSGVEYGQILERAREELGGSKGLKKVVDGMSDPRVFRFQAGLARLWPGDKVPGFVSRTLTDEPPEARLPRIPRPTPWPELDESELPPVKGEVHVLEGCAMRVLYPDVHDALRRLLRRVGFTVRNSESGCCGALHAHSGFIDDAKNLADRLVESMPGDIPVIVDSAGCGSFMKEYGLLAGKHPLPDLGAGQLLRSSTRPIPRGRESEFSARVFDASEFLVRNGLIEALKASPGVPATATYHDACHLAHGQRIRHEPRDLIQNVPRLKFVELTESDMCCGSAGVYNLTQPGYARRLLDRKWANVEASGAEILATGNPGCHSWIQQASDEHGRKVRVVHTLELLESSFSGLRD